MVNHFRALLRLSLLYSLTRQRASLPPGVVVVVVVEGEEGLEGVAEEGEEGEEAEGAVDLAVEEGRGIGHVLDAVITALRDGLSATDVGLPSLVTLLVEAV